MNLTDVLQAPLIRHPLKADVKSAALEELLSLIYDSGRINNYDTVKKAILDRENIMSTGVGNGVAIPHCKTADAPSFSVALGIHPGGLDFQSLDKKPTHIIFMLTGPEDDPGTHIRLLSRISRIVSENATREAIMGAATAEEILGHLIEKERELPGITS